jgi:hypothetical protein
VEKFLIVEHIEFRHGLHGEYIEYEYSLPQILEAEKSFEWRKAAAKYLSVSIDCLDAKVSEILAQWETYRIKEDVESAALRRVLEEKRQADHAELQRLTASVRGGLMRIGCLHPLCDGWRKFEPDEILEYVNFADQRGRITGDYIQEFYRLWTAGSGYCNPKGVLRRIIAPVKKRLIRILLYIARHNNWVYGVGLDGKQIRVLYFDTPHGQVSFHLMQYEREIYPKYTGDWSGVRNSNEILARLFDCMHNIGFSDTTNH